MLRDEISDIREMAKQEAELIAKERAEANGVTDEDV